MSLMEAVAVLHYGRRHDESDYYHRRYMHHSSADGGIALSA